MSTYNQCNVHILQKNWFGCYDYLHDTSRIPIMPLVKRWAVKLKHVLNNTIILLNSTKQNFVNATTLENIKKKSSMGFIKCVV